ncbi:hypothetical protein AJ79_01718 [Helicocarpus griseus UAMH5409]|uniref:Uncharacterized protein n=1 Tax=Helicocarpus griseus UAMH5409 TaxID=1447875 RepID=A0A2B7Y6H6_9EURO|nr:hypothetical protein AJ79_01718 [Helicocarpus griseus UAMH5409]
MNWHWIVALLLASTTQLDAHRTCGEDGVSCTNAAVNTTLLPPRENGDQRVWTCALNDTPQVTRTLALKDMPTLCPPLSLGHDLDINPNIKAKMLAKRKKASKPKPKSKAKPKKKSKKKSKPKSKKPKPKPKPKPKSNKISLSFSDINELAKQAQESASQVRTRLELMRGALDKMQWTGHGAAAAQELMASIERESSKLSEHYTHLAQSLSTATQTYSEIEKKPAGRFGKLLSDDKLESSFKPESKSKSKSKPKPKPKLTTTAINLKIRENIEAQGKEFASQVEKADSLLQTLSKFASQLSGIDGQLAQKIGTVKSESEELVQRASDLASYLTSAKITDDKKHKIGRLLGKRGFHAKSRAKFKPKSKSKPRFTLDNTLINNLQGQVSKLAKEMNFHAEEISTGIQHIEKQARAEAKAEAAKMLKQAEDIKTRIRALANALKKPISDTK